MKLKGFKQRMTLFAFAVVLLISIISCTDKRLSDYTVPELDFKTMENNGFVVPEGWEATLWAESPALYNPTNMDVDAKGRIWVTEAVNYRDFNNDPEKRLHFERRSCDDFRGYRWRWH